MEIKEVQNRKTLMIRTVTPVSSISDAMADAFTKLAVFMEENGIAFAGPPYAKYYNMDMEALDLEMGFPISAETETEGSIKLGELTAGKIASAVHTGPYDKLEDTYIKLMEYVKGEGFETEEWMYEFYLNSPMEVKPEELQTEICYPLK